MSPSRGLTMVSNTLLIFNIKGCAEHLCSIKFNKLSRIELTVCTIRTPKISCTACTSSSNCFDVFVIDMVFAFIKIRLSDHTSLSNK